MSFARTALLLAAFTSTLSLVGLAAPPAPKGSAPTYKPLAEIVVGGEGGWDYLTLDGATSMLYLSHGTSYAVVDTRSDKVVGTIADTPGAHGFAIAPGLGRGFTTNGRENKVSVVDLKTMKTVSKIDVGDRPDAILYAEASGHVYVFDAGSKSATVIDPKSMKVVGTVELGGAPEYAVEDVASGHIYNNLEDTSEIVTIDERTNRVVARWSVAPGEEPSGLAYDAKHHRLFSGCSNNMMVAVDAKSGKVVAHWAIGRGVDACRFDPSLGLVFASCGDGTVTIAHEDGPDAYSVVQTLTTAPGARTMTLDEKTHRIYLVTAQLQPAPEPAPGQKRARPTVVPGTFKVLVFGPQ